jgi:hypothetical protein
MRRGYRTDHGKWWPLLNHARAEIERGNYFPDTTGHETRQAIWVTHTKRAAKKYGKIIIEIDLTGATLFHTDNEGGYLYVK